MNRISLLIAVCLALPAAAGCSREAAVPPGVIKIKNDSQDRDHNILKVRGGGTSYTLRPGEYAYLPRHTTSISFSRQYRDFVRSYQVECPANRPKGISIKLIDVHVNRIAGGCRTVSAKKS